MFVCVCVFVHVLMFVVRLKMPFPMLLSFKFFTVAVCFRMFFSSPFYLPSFDLVLRGIVAFVSLHLAARIASFAIPKHLYKVGHSFLHWWGEFLCFADAIEAQQQQPHIFLILLQLFRWFCLHFINASVHFIIVTRLLCLWPFSATKRQLQQQFIGTK